MFEITILKNGLTLITVPLPHLNSVTTLVAVKAGSRYETKKINGISHFLEHMFFKGSKKYPSTEIISNIVDGIGAINNAATHKEWTYYWIKSSTKNLETAIDIVSSMLKEPLFAEEEIEREKGVIAEELRMYRDMPQRYVFELFENLLIGDQPLGWDIGGQEEITNSLNRNDFLKYVKSLYAPENMALVFAGNFPKNIKEIAEDYFDALPKYEKFDPKPFKPEKQTKPKVAVHYKKTDQANVALGTLGYDRYNPKRYAARVLAVVLGEGMSSRLFMQVRERRGLAYHVMADHDSYMDTGIFLTYAGLKLEKVMEGLQVIKDELEKTTTEKVSEEELKKAKEIIRGKLAIRSESTNFLAEHFGTEFVLDRELETFEDFMKNIDSVTLDQIQEVAIEMFKKENYNLQVIGPFKNTKQFEKLLNS
jgi:predicted Zn-dependent peptidase